MDSFIEDSVFDPEVSIICLLPIVVPRKLGYADTSWRCDLYRVSGAPKSIATPFPFSGFRVLSMVFEG